MKYIHKRTGEIVDAEFYDGDVRKVQKYFKGCNIVKDKQDTLIINEYCGDKLVVYSVSKYRWIVACGKGITKFMEDTDFNNSYKEYKK